MACRISELVIDAEDPDRLAAFWCEVLGYVELAREGDGSIEIGPPGVQQARVGVTAMTEETDIGVYLGLDVGKGEHHATAVSPAGKKVFDKPLPNSEPKLREL
ncbi:transposase, partial [Streptomyces sp. NPDC003038]|uniref:VOC family protein n=1 Tax=Streptomyces sp. NPDC003038 TaxID=3154546 RepID=UPI0033A9EB75